MDDEEVEAVLSYFCMPGECEILGSEVNIRIQLQKQGQKESSAMQHDNIVQVKLALDVGSSYPGEVPKMSLLSTEIDRNVLSGIKQHAEELANTLIEQPMIISLVTFIQEELESIREQLFSTKTRTKLSTHETIEMDCTALFHIDHMRSKTKYVKTMEKWTNELGLCGSLVFYGRLILVLLQGCQTHIKDFIVRLRNTNVDVDSRGHACKERMMSVLCEVETPDLSKRFTNFTVCEIEDEDSLQNIFLSAGLESIYINHVKSIKYFS